MATTCVYWSLLSICVAALSCGMTSASIQTSTPYRQLTINCLWPNELCAESDGDPIGGDQRMIPRDVRVSMLSYQTARLSWSASGDPTSDPSVVTNLTGFLITYRAAGAGNYKLYKRVAADLAPRSHYSTLITYLSKKTIYLLTVRAISREGFLGNASEPIRFATDPYSVFNQQQSWYVPGNPVKPNGMLINTDELLVILVAIGIWGTSIFSCLHQWGKLRTLQPREPRFKHKPKNIQNVEIVPQADMALIYPKKGCGHDAIWIHGKGVGQVSGSTGDGGPAPQPLLYSSMPDLLAATAEAAEWQSSGAADSGDDDVFVNALSTLPVAAPPPHPPHPPPPLEGNRNNNAAVRTPTRAHSLYTVRPAAVTSWYPRWESEHNPWQGPRRPRRALSTSVPSGAGTGTNLLVVTTGVGATPRRMTSPTVDIDTLLESVTTTATDRWRPYTLDDRSVSSPVLPSAAARQLQETFRHTTATASASAAARRQQFSERHMLPPYSSTPQHLQQFMIPTVEVAEDTPPVTESSTTTPDNLPRSDSATPLQQGSSNSGH